MNRIQITTILLVASIGMATLVLNAKAVEDDTVVLVGAYTLDPCAKTTGRFQIRGSQKKSSISSAAKSLVHNSVYYSRAIVVESLTITKESVTKALDLAIESI